MSDSKPMPTADELNALGAFYHHKGNLGAARAHYDAALLVNPDHDQALQNLSGILCVGRNHRAALSIARRAIKYNPHNYNAWANYGMILFHLGETAEALRIGGMVLQHLPDAAPLWQNYGLFFAQDGDLYRAINAFDRSLELSPNVQSVMSDRALTIMGTGQLV